MVYLIKYTLLYPFQAFVDEVMDLVELDNLKNAIVGISGVTGLSTEQRKRLTIAVELVANPSIIFMDEPTSGLDARAAAIVMRTVRNTVDTGRTVVCTIHQPSIDIFESFDEVKYNPVLILHHYFTYFCFQHLLSCCTSVTSPEKRRPSNLCRSIRPAFAENH